MFLSLDNDAMYISTSCRNLIAAGQITSQQLHRKCVRLPFGTVGQRFPELAPEIQVPEDDVPQLIGDRETDIPG